MTSETQRPTGRAPNGDPPIIVLVYEGWAQTFASLELYHQQYGNIWVVDNASPTDSSAELLSRFPGIRFLRMPRNGGWAYAYNHALDLALREGHDAAYVMNNDAAPLAAETVPLAIETLRRTGAAAVGSAILDWPCRKVEYDGEIHLNGEGPAVDGLSQEILPADRVHGAGAAISLAAYRDVGPFYEGYFLYHEETDWLIRAKAQGWSLWVDRRSRVRHVAGASNESFNAAYYLTRNRFIAYRRGVMISGRTDTLVDILIQEVRNIYGPSKDHRFAVKQGIIDGLIGREGARPRAHARPLIELLFWPVRLAMKIRALTRSRSRSIASDLAVPQDC